MPYGVAPGFGLPVRFPLNRGLGAAVAGNLAYYRRGAVKKALAVSGLFVLLFGGIALAEPVETFYYQKTLSSPLTTSAEMTAVMVAFSIYDAATGGNLLCSETKPVEANSHKCLHG